MFMFHQILYVLRAIRSAPRRAIFVVLNVILAVVLVVLLNGYATSMFQGMRTGLIRSGLGNVQIFQHGLETRGNLQSVNILMPHAEAEMELARLRASPEVAIATPRIEGSVMATNGNASQGGQIVGIDPEAESVLSAGLKITAGHELFSSEKNGVLLGAGIAAALGLGPGDRVTILGNTVNGVLNAADMTVEGLVTTGNRQADARLMYVNLPFLQKFLDSDGYSRLVVLLRHTDDTDAFVRQIGASLGKGMVIRNWRQLAPNYGEVVDLLGSIFFGIEVAVLLFVALTLGTMISASVIERTRETGIARALGDSGFEIASRFALEGILLGVIGGALGLGISILAAAAVNQMHFIMPRPPGSTVNYPLRILVTGQSLVVTGLAVVCVSFLASLLPAWRAARTPVVEAMRHV